MGRTDLALCAALKTACSSAGPGALGATGRTVSEVRASATKDIDECIGGEMEEER